MLATVLLVQQLEYTNLAIRFDHRLSAAFGFDRQQVGLSPQIFFACLENELVPLDFQKPSDIQVAFSRGGALHCAERLQFRAQLRATLGKDLLGLKRGDPLASYWIKRDPPGPKPSSMSKQF